MFLQVLPVVKGFKKCQQNETVVQKTDISDGETLEYHIFVISL